ncbi:MAG: NAD(P)-dependent oxidoreductase [Maricaulaceae bacterium]
MTESLLKFVERDQAYPGKRDAAARREDFAEIYAPYAQAAAQAQSARCSQCGVPFCQHHCPLSNAIPDWLMLAAQGRLQEAYQRSAATNLMPEICGRICPQDRLCEGGCVIEQSGHGSVTIGAIETYITENAWDEGWVEPLRPGPARGQSVGVIGAGPAGLSAAERLRELGYDVVVYDRYDRPGGLLIYGIPNFKLDKTIVERRCARLAAGGITFELNTEVGADITVESLRDRHDAVLIAVGAYQPRALQCPGAGADGVAAALDFLTAANRAGLGDRVPEHETGALHAAGKRVVVIGGGDTAMDCVRTAVRQGAASVHCLYRRDQANMPGSAREVGHAQEEGVAFDWLAAPSAVLTHDGRASRVRAARMRLGPPDASGRRAPEPIPGASFDREADLVIKALGFEPDHLPQRLGAPDLKVNRWGAAQVDFATLATNLPGVFAAGDCARGASLVVWAIRDGREAAKGVHDYLMAQAAAPASPARVVAAA